MLLNSSDPDAALQKIGTFKIQSKNVRDYVEESLGKRKPKNAEKVEEAVDESEGQKTENTI